MKLRSGKTICGKPTKVCGHTCELWHDKCCACSDKRPKKGGYYAFNQSYLERVAIVKRDYYYCPTCKKNNAAVKKKDIVDTPKLEPQLDVEKLKKKSDEQKKIIESLNKTIAIYEKKIATLNKELDDADNEERAQNLYDSGMGELVYHLGYCSDVVGDCWLPDYESGGLAGLKKSLRKTSKWIHKHDKCEECKKLISDIHD